MILKNKKNIYFNILFIFILFLILFYIVYLTQKTFVLKQINENFVNNPNYCRSVNGNFIYITNQDDTRCLKNQNKNSNNKFNISGKGNCYKDNTWGIFHNNICYTFNNFFSKFYNINYMNFIDTIKNKSLEEEEEEENNQNSLSNLIKNKRKKRKECDSIRLPNSTPCFELFENSSNGCSIDQLKTLQSSIDDPDDPINLDQQCQDFKNDINFGFYQPLCGTTQVSYDCRKYYKSNNNKVISDDDTPLYGIYKPNFYVPLKEDSTINSTGCFEKSLDFNDLCASINNNQLFGAYKILNGANGNCYQDNGLEDTTKSNAMCSQNFYNERSIVQVNDGYSTKCLPIFSNFTDECKNIITNNNNFDIEAYDINSYDCPPNKVRTKCRLKNKQ